MGSLNQPICSMAASDSISRVLTQTRYRAFQTLHPVFQTLDQAFDFLLRLQKLGRAFERLDRVF